MHPDSVGRPPPPPGSSSGGPALRLPPLIALLLAVMAIITAVLQVLGPVVESKAIVMFGLYLFLDGSFQWDRLYSLLTSVFLHDGWLHLLFNGLWIATLGSIIHRVLGNRGFLLLFFGSAIAGGLVYSLVVGRNPGRHRSLRGRLRSDRRFRSPRDREARPVSPRACKACLASRSS